jgi:alkylhydroperoxidase/carboxymuconolactone decarboxylase family protein YurZ
MAPKTLADGLTVARKYRDAAKAAGTSFGLGAAGLNSLEAMKIVPDLRELTREMIFTQIYSREELSMKQRSIVVLSTLITQGVDPEVSAAETRFTQLDASCPRLAQRIASELRRQIFHRSRFMSTRDLMSD